MEIRDYARILRTNGWIVSVVVALALAGGWGYTQFLTSPKYEACARLFVTTEGGTSVGEAYQNNLFSKERVASYAGLATSTQVAQRVVDQLGLDMSAGELQSKVTATPIPDTVLLDLCVSDSDATTARRLTNAVAGQLTQLVLELETSARGGAPAAGATIVDEADQPGSPTSPSLIGNLALAGAVGLMIGLLLALGRGLLDRSVRDRRRVEEISGGSVLGGIPRDRHRTEVAVADFGPGAPLAEPLRSLRTTIRFLGGGTPPKVIAVASAHAGDGRTTTAIDLAAVLAEAGKSVALVGGDLRNATLGHRLGLSQDTGLSTVLSGEHTLGESLQQGAVAGVTVLPAGPVPPNPSELLGSDRAQSVVDTLREQFDYVVVDTPPLLEVSDGAVLGALSDGVIMLVRNGKTTRDQLSRGLTVLSGVGAAVLGSVLTFEGVAKATSSPANSTSARPAPDPESQRPESQRPEPAARPTPAATTRPKPAATTKSAVTAEPTD